MKIVCVALLAALAAQVSPSLKRAEPAAPNAIRGVVLRAGDASPIPGTRVTLRGFDETSATTDGDGRFVVSASATGFVTLEFAANGYVSRFLVSQSAADNSQEQLNRLRTDNTTVTFLEQARARKADATSDIVVELTPTATITGSVFDATGAPLSRVLVQLIRTAYDNLGNKSLQIAREEITNDRGEYRLFWITPGRYYLSAGGSQFLDNFYSNARRISNVNDVNVPVERAFFPNTPDISRATLLDIEPGASISGLDFHVARSKEYRIRGRVIDASGKPLTWGSVHFTAEPADSRAGVNRLEIKGGYDLTSFEIVKVPPGQYRLRASDKNQKASMIVTVRESDVDGVALALLPVPPLKGRVEMESGVPPGEPVWFRLIGVRSRDSSENEDPSGGLDAPLSWKTDPDGTFSTFSMEAPPASYRMAVMDFRTAFMDSLSGGPLFIREIWLADIDVSRRPLTAEDAKAGPLRVVLSSGVASLEGTVRNALSEPVVNADVVAVPEDRSRTELYRHGYSSADGRYQIKHAAPGRYTVFAWQTIQPYAWFDPAISTQYEAMGAPLEIGPNAQARIDLRVIPSAPK